jgi:hypothetical protein
MTIDVVTRTIEFILAPAVMVSACATTLIYVLNRYVGIGDRLRALSHERLQLVRENGGLADAMSIAGHRLGDIDAQIPPLLAHHKLLRNSATGISGATIVFFLTMVVIALARVLDFTWASSLALYIFLAGILLLTWAIVLSTLEISHSHLTVERDLAWIKEARPVGDHFTAPASSPPDRGNGPLPPT